MKAHIVSKSSLLTNPVTVHKLSILIPVYHSENTIGPLVDVVVRTLSPHVTTLELILVNDGSMDTSHARAISSVEKYPGIVKYIRLARNFGEHNAVMCGLHYVTGDCVVIIDDDFQNPPSEILKLVETLQEGYDVVYSYYASKQHSWFRNIGSAFNNWVATKMLKKPKDLYLSSFKAISAPLVRTILQYQGPYPYIDGIIMRSTAFIGRQLCQHDERLEGHSNYTLVKLLRLWLNMFTGFSILPLRLASIIGLGMSVFAVGLTLFFLISYQMGGIIFKQPIPPGWASTIVATTLFAGVQLCMLGLVGEYVGRVFLTMNRLPQFVVRETFGADAPEEEK